MTSWSTLVLGHKRLVALGWLVVLAAGVLLVGKVEGRLSQQFDLPGQPACADNQQILRTYGNGGPGQALVAAIGLPQGMIVDRPSPSFGRRWPPSPLPRPSRSGMRPERIPDVESAVGADPGRPS
jgi:hypothetical protein